MNYVVFVRDPDGVFTGPGQAAEEIDDLIKSYTLGKVRAGVESESGRVEELERMVGDGVDQWDQAQRLADQVIEDAGYWGIPMLSSFKDLAVHLGVELKEE